MIGKGLTDCRLDFIGQDKWLVFFEILSSGALDRWQRL